MEKARKQLRKAEEQLTKADLFFENKDFKKAAKHYDDVGEKYFCVKEYYSAEQSFAKAATAYANQDNINNSLSSLRNAGDVCILSENFLNAHKHFNTAIKLVGRLNGEKDKEFNYLLFSSLSFLCYLTVGRPDQGLTLVKRLKKNVRNEVFKDNPQIRLVKDLTIALRKKERGYLDKIEQEFSKYKFNEIEATLAKKALVTANAQVVLSSKLTLDKDQYSFNDKIHVSLELDTNPLSNISKHPFYDYEIKSLKIKKIDIVSSDNLSIQKKPIPPIDVPIGEKQLFEIEFKINFQIDEPYVGPINLTCEMDELLTFYVESKVNKPEILSPPSKLEISTRNLRPPLIDQTFPFEMTVENVGEGETFDVRIDVEIPEQLKVMRGTTSKQIYSLRMHENMKWEIQIKPIEAGDFQIKATIKFKDSDQNEMEQVQEFFLSIKL
ncbi:MAG: hypothetical protein JW891_00360 [Candidatus Lokiarchaeota archaeon]|nr:hypothetical protein [Candidatus Lokiarchaeota archaeon]